MKKMLVLFLAAVMVVGTLGGCGKPTSTNDNKTTDKMQEGSNTSSVEAPSVESSSEETKFEKWPEPVTLKWYVRGKEDEFYQHLWSDMEAIKKIQEATNIKIEFEVATNGDSYIPMMTGNTYPDIITAKNLESYPGRLSAMYKDGISIKLDELIDDYMPNFKKILTENPGIAKDLKLDSGEYTFFSQLFDTTNDVDREAKSSFGITIRKDWLEAVGKDVPTTIDEWYDVLKAFKTQDPNGNGQPDEEPVCMASSGWKYFMSAYGILDDPSVGEDGKIIFGYATDQYKRYLETMNKWYSEGLIYNMFEKTSLEALNESIVNNICGAWKGTANNFDESAGSKLSTLREKVPTAEFVAAPWPKETADSKHYCYCDITSFSRDTTIITSNCKQPEAAAYLIDYLYSEEGSTLITWGVEGESYDVVDGKKVIKPEMSEEFDYHNAKVPNMYKYADSDIVNFPSFGQYSDYVFATKPEGYVEACKVWSKGETYKTPYPVQLSPEQSDKVDSATEGMSAYINDMRWKFITGQEPLTSFDAYVDQLELLGMNTLVEVWQECYDAYLAR